MLQTITHKLVVNGDKIPDDAMREVQSEFEKYNHRPSKAHIEGLREIAKAMTRMAFRVHECDEIVRLFPEVGQTLAVSFLPCGMGKTTTMVETIKALLAVPEYEPIAFIIFLQKLDEIAKLVDRMKLDEKDFAILTSDDELNRLGNADKKAARVLFTTQAMLEQRVFNKGKGVKSFSEISDFYFDGKPRQVRVWDEAILPSHILTLERRRLMQVIRDISQVNPALADCIDKFCIDLSSKEDGDSIQMPDLERFGVSLEEALNHCGHDDYRESIEALYSLQSTIARVAKDQYGTTTLQYADILPADLAPMLILDASGQQRATYEYWFKNRKGIQFLESPEKSYKGLTVHHWNTGAGKQAQSKMRDDYKDIAEGIARTIKHDVPSDKKVLVIHYKPSRHIPNMEAEITARLSDVKTKVSFLTWGRHTATNDFSEYEYVFLAGVPQYTTAQYRATGYAAKGMSVDTELTDEEFTNIRLGEIRHHILQAACRGKVRHAVGDECPPGCHLYIIYSTQSGLPGRELTERVFPDSSYETWTPVVRLQGKKQKELAGLLETKGPGDYSLKSLMKASGITRPNRLESTLNDIEPYLRIERGLYTRIAGVKVQVQKPKRPQDWLDHPF